MPIESGEWIAPEPRALPALRTRLVEQMDNPFEHMGTSAVLAEGRGTLNPDRANPDRAARLLLGDEKRRLAGAHLYHVTADMTHVAMQAGRKLPSWETRRDDLPASCGFMLFGAPIGQYTSESKYIVRDRPVQIVGASWGPSDLFDSEADSLWVTLWSATDEDGYVEQLQRNYPQLSRNEARVWQRKMQAEVQWDNEAILSFDSPNIRVKGEVRPVDPAKDGSILSETTATWAQTVRAAWLLMKRQPDAKRPPIADVDELHVSRTMRRRAEREGVNPAPVRVVSLHQPPRAQTQRAHPDGYTVTVRSHVTGHIRWQPYRSRNVIEPIWIDAHVRGPEGAPFKQHQTRVNVLDRPPGGR